MAKSIFDIAKKLGLNSTEVLAKAKELHIDQAKVSTSRLDNTTAEWFEQELIKSNSALTAKFAPKQITPQPTIERRIKPGLAMTAADSNNGVIDLPTQPQTRFLGEQRRLVEVFAGVSWGAVLEHRIYSCPDTPDRDFVFGATALLLKTRVTQRRVPLLVEAVQACDLRAPNFLETVPTKFRSRLNDYIFDVQNTPGMLDGDCNYRFYFLSSEFWPDWLQQLAASAPDTEWAAIRSMCFEPSCFFEWPQVGMLLWPGCTRDDESQQHEYPAKLASQLLRLGLIPDTRNNGPAIMAFRAAGGIRPVCGDEGWHIHHIYDNTGPINGGVIPVPHAVRDGNLFTHSGGLVAAHPIAHHLAHQSDLLKWLLRREAFLRFGFDPMNVFTARP